MREQQPFVSMDSEWKPTFYRRKRLPARQIQTGERQMERIKDEELYKIEGGSLEDFVGGLLYGLVVLLAM
jgi:hypothetical protein